MFRRAAFRLVAVLIALVVAALLLYACRAWLLPAAASWLDLGADAVKSDYVLVLPGNAETRPFAAAAIWKAGLARAVLVPQTQPSADEQDGLQLPEHQITRRVLELRGVPRDRIVILKGQSSSTFSDAVALGQFLDKAPGRTVSVVTNAYHTRRARWVLCHVLGRRAEDLRYVAVPADEFNQSNWWHDPQGLSAYLGEYLKFAYYQVRHGYAGAAMLGLGILGTVLFFNRKARKAKEDAAAGAASL